MFNNENDYKKIYIMHSVNTYNEDGETPLTIAVKSNLQFDIAHLLTLDGIDVNEKNLNGETALMIAVRYNVDAIPILLQDPYIDVNIVNEFQDTALILSVKHSPKAFDFLMQSADIDINKLSIGGLTVLMIACTYQLDIVEKLLKYPHLDVNAVDKNMKSALLYAAYRNYNALVCLANDDRVNMDQLDIHGNNVFIYAIKSGKLENIVYLLKHPDVNVNQKDNFGANAFVLAQNEDTIRILLKERKININTSNKIGVTPLMIAAKLCDAVCIQDFFKDLEKIDINARDKNGMTAFMYAVRDGNIEATACFLKDKRVDINLVDTNGRNALRYGLYDEEKMSLLLNSNRVDVNLKDEDGQTVLMQVIIKGEFSKIMMLLKSATIELNCVDKHGENALFIAMNVRNEDAFRELMKHPKINAHVSDLGIFSNDNEEDFVFYAQMAYNFNHGTKQVVDIQHEIARRLEDVNILEFQRTLIKKEDIIDEEEEEEIKISHHKKVSELIEKEEVLLLKAFDINVYDVKSGKTCIGYYSNNYASQLLMITLPGIDLYKYDYNLTYMHDYIENKDDTFKKVMTRSFPPEIRYLKTMRCKNNEMSKLWIMIDDQATCYSNPYNGVEIDKMTLHPYLRTNDYNIILPLKKYASRLLNILFRIEKVPHKDTRLYRLIY